ncbi:MAG TPA: TadE/TadG family type IV pilus assembly protein [Alphaproteobacteria bacterium]|nr:TadE/TadG family type IV pilus assembly protein [Alphaproteobacteria bacterium]
MLSKSRILPIGRKFLSATISSRRTNGQRAVRSRLTDGYDSGRWRGWLGPIKQWIARGDGAAIVLATRNNESGAVAVYIGIITALLIGFAGLAIDLSRLGTLQTQLQNAADQAALSGAAELDGKDDSVIRAARAVYGESGVEAQLTVNNENIAGEGTITITRFRLLSAIPPDTTAIDCPVWVSSFAAAQSYTPTGGGAHCANGWQNVRFIEVVAEQRTIDVSLIAVLRSLGAASATQATTTARAVAGFTQFVCQVVPMFTCNPSENIAGGGPVIMNKGQMLLMKAGGGKGAQYGPGNYGLLDPIFDNQGAKSVAENLASAGSEGCFSVSGVEVNQGQKTGPVKTAVNTRFDIYDNPNFSGQQGNDEFRPARNVTKGCYGMTCGTTYGNFNQDPSLWDPNAKGAPFPRAGCFYNGACSESCWSGECRMSANTDWSAQNRTTYWSINHPNSVAPGVTPTGNQYSRPANWDDPSFTRYDTYRWEIDSGHVPDRTRDDGPSQPCGADPGGYPASYNASCSDGEQGRPSNYTGGTLSDEPERRIIIIAVVNCIEHGPINGNSTPPLPVEQYAKFFVTEPVDIHSGNTNQDIYGEFVGFVSPGADDGIIRDVVQLYR